MAEKSDISIRPGEVGDVTKQIDELAQRVQHVMQTEAPNLTVVASGRDEVSQRVAKTTNEVHASFTKASDQTATELTEVAATLRGHSGRIQETDLA
ncbi:PE family protein [Mycobacterium talmoniae]|uniref:PE family protein n=1 Tax=Mycobacterium talmoniae TaxID=1858794 RepID=A0A1S1N266_9MYCO|nr:MULTISPECIES: PE domain-containing protein [Mycobacterium]OHU92278.1 PE family protein [Mycobacterium talmoniae]PQM44843.1 hypothetical protein C1Y40_04993 [Mycobacterium talmoniae]TDH46456.1 PE family protein [Mycobacterium eburneum]